LLPQTHASETRTLAESIMSTPKKQPSSDDILNKALDRAFKGGIAGSMAAAMQVTSLMWVRTTMNYQYRYGGNLPNALKTIYAQGGGGTGGLMRFYRGYGFAMFQGPLARFGDTAANVGVLALLNDTDATKNWPTQVKTVFASLGAASWRVVLMPIDACKTTLQVEGADGLKKLFAKVKVGGPTVLWHGAGAAVGATFVGHYPWFATYNALDSYMAPREGALGLARNAGMGFCASIVSDTCSNSIRVLKAYKQTSTVPISYQAAAKTIIAKEGLLGLFGRGLGTRFLANGLNGMLFSVMWKKFQKDLGL